MSAAAKDINKESADFDALVISGDITTSGSKIEYMRLNDVFAKFRTDTFILASGNHDIPSRGGALAWDVRFPPAQNAVLHFRRRREKAAHSCCFFRTVPGVSPRLKMSQFFPVRYKIHYSCPFAYNLSQPKGR